MGNPTCDLDSAVCALVHGFFVYTDRVQGQKNEKIAVIPIMNISKKEFRVKTEVVYYLGGHNLPLNLLTFRDEIDLRKLNAEGKLELILVDHHTLPKEDLSLADSVVEIIDHRPQDVTWSWSGRTINLQTVGSCATLVAKNILEKRRMLLDSQVSNLLRGPILIDTCNFSKEADRATPMDFDVIRQLEELNTLHPSRDQLYQDILNAKTDISQLTPDDLIIKDLKVVNGIPIVGLPILVENFIKMDGAHEALDSFAMKENTPFAILIGLDLKNDVVTRDIAVFSLSSNELENKVIEALMTSTNPKLELTETHRFSKSGRTLIHYKQGNVKASRKQILPIIQSVSRDCTC
ncbi:exopolyphosphatase PRUNE1 isoform X2 [Cephus cinctus]|nr:exopolyphosphatase PRUNE1 isoform X2 [Cephus cinctus]